jgi:uncharacterized repeat protein (TIGR03803 family)
MMAIASRALFVPAAILLLAGSLCSQTLNTLFTFGQGKLGSQPLDPVVAGPNGVVYGVTDIGGLFGMGVVFELAPPSTPGQPWSSRVLHEFSTTEGTPQAGLTLGPDGVLYGTTFTNNAGSVGTVFELRPPSSAGRRWRESTLYSFTLGADCQYPQGPPVFGPHNALYGTTYQGGAYNFGCVYRLDPPASTGDPWKEQILWSFAGSPNDGFGAVGPVVFGSGGAIYGVTRFGGSGEYGTVFELDPANGSWKESVLYNFGAEFGDSYPTGVILGEHHELYGTTLQPDGRACQNTYPCGVLFELKPPSTVGQPWAENTIATFTFDNEANGLQPYAPPVLAADGAIYGTTGSGGAYGYGTIFKFQPPTAHGAPWTETLLYSFADKGDGWIPGQLVLGRDGNYYGTTGLVYVRGGVGNYGTVFQFIPQ